MNPILGLVRLDGTPVQPSYLSAAANRLGKTGALRSVTSREGSAVLYRLATGDKMVESGPGGLAPSEPNLLLSANARIDNREELYRVLGLRAPLAATTDEELLVAAYRRWGLRCAVQLIGDYAFALWDEREQRLVCVRDHAGTRPFYYHHTPGSHFAFSSELACLLAVPGVGEALNPARVADYLADVFYDDEYTFYTDILRLPPSHVLTVDARGLGITRYWSLDPEREVSFPSDEAYAEGFREVFSAAVACRLRDADPVAVTLSGGLDSSAVAVVAQDVLARIGRAPLQTFTNVYPLVPECDERPYVDSVLQRGRYEAHFIPGDATSVPLSALRRLVREVGQPVFAPGVGASDELRRRLRDVGVRVFLSGHGGDEVVSHAWPYLKELALAGRWWTLQREVLAARHGEDEGSSLSLLVQLVLGGVEFRLAGLPGMKRPRSLLRRMRRRMGRRSAPGSAPAAAETYVDPGLAAEVDLIARHEEVTRRHGGSPLSVRQRDFQTLTSPMQPMALEAVYSIAASSGLEERVPFWDRRLVEYCLALPSEQKRRYGQGRYVLRAALHDELPALVRERRDKTRFDASLRYGILHNDRAALDEVLASLGELDGLANVAALEEDLQVARLEEDLQACLLLLKVAALIEWLRSSPSQ